MVTVRLYICLKPIFPMRGNFAEAAEPDFLKFWQDNKIYEKRLKKRDGAPKFILLTVLRMPMARSTSAMH